MTSFFDSREREAANHLSSGDTDSAISVEQEAIDIINQVISDPEFPSDLRAEAENAISIHKINSSPESRQWADVMKMSKLLSDLHDIFHKLAERRVTTRFGLLRDNPEHILNQIKENS